jgi:hypothetical protein
MDLSLSLLVRFSLQSPKFCCGFRWWYIGTAPRIRQLDAVILAKNEGVRELCRNRTLLDAIMLSLATDVAGLNSVPVCLSLLGPKSSRSTSPSPNKQALKGIIANPVWFWLWGAVWHVWWFCFLEHASKCASYGSYGDGHQVLTVHHVSIGFLFNRPNSVGCQVVVHWYPPYIPPAGYNLFGGKQKGRWLL